MSWSFRRLLLSWTGRRRWASTRALVAVCVAVFLFVVLAPSLLSPFGVQAPWLNWLNTKCNERGFACNAMTELLALAFAIPAGFLLFLALRLTTVKRRYLAAIRKHPERLFPSWTTKRPVVGRDALCEVIDADFALNGMRMKTREGRKRRPRIIVGDIGAGKTGVLVRLARVLADRGAVPVPVSLRLAREHLDFVELAHTEFLRRTQRYVLAEDEADRIWRWLLDAGAIVILADGLEEALLDSVARETRIRVAIAETMKDEVGVPIVVSSRPAPFLATLDAAVIRLERLPAGEAVSALEGSVGGEERAAELVGKAEVDAMPFALELLEDLAEKDLLEKLDDKLEGVELRMELMRRWLDWRKASSPAWQLSLGDDGERTTQTLEAFAAVALCRDTLAAEQKWLECSSWRDELIGHPVSRADYENTARLADELRLVDDTGSGVRFRNNLLQAYLGSRALRRALADDLPGDRFLDTVEHVRGRELMMAIVFACADDDFDADARLRAHGWLLSNAERETRDEVRLALLAAAAEVERKFPAKPTPSVTDQLSGWWPADRHRDEQRDDAKRRLLRRLGDLERRDGYEALWNVCDRDDDPAARFTAAHAIAAGGDDAFDALRRRLGAGDPVAACVAPLLAGRCADPDKAAALGTLVRAWADDAGNAHPLVVRRLAQGLRWQSNRRRIAEPVREELVRASVSLLRQADWWSTLAVLQALTLWQLTAADRHTQPPCGTMDEWLAGNRASTHVFVRAARRMCCCALCTREPSRYLWMDETLSLRRIGSGARRPTSELWLAPTGGWLSLEPVAQQLLADVVLLINLARFPDHGSEHELPGPLSERGPGSVVLTRYGDGTPRPTVAAAADIPRLDDISASFARGQQRILRRRLRRRACAPWQQGSRGDYLKAWETAALTAPE